MPFMEQDGREFPFSIPNGWFAVRYSDELGAGDVQAARYFGEELVLYRTESGEARVLDAFCAHLGAHLGHGGKVVGETIQCPFHAWRYDKSGACVAIPYAERIPQKARLDAWPVVERNGLLWVWHHAGGEPPSWEVPEVPEAHDPEWTDYERHFWSIRTRNQEMGENAVDRAHFKYVHGLVDLPESEITVDGVYRRALQRSKFPTPRGVVEGAIDAHTYGMGCSIIRYSGICDTVQVTSVVAVDTEHVEVRYGFTQKKIDGKAPEGGVGPALIQNICFQMGQDIPIWEHKIYQPRPMLCDGDGPIAEFRRWCEQFYTPAA